MPGTKVTSIARVGDGWQAQTGKGQKIDAQIIVAGIGIVPNVSLRRRRG